jgi:hypothetical protein
MFQLLLLSTNFLLQAGPHSEHQWSCLIRAPNEGGGEVKWQNERTLKSYSKSDLIKLRTDNGDPNQTVNYLWCIHTWC